MDWPNERYVRLYTRDSTTWKLLDWKARALLPLLMRKLNRAGVLELGSDGVLGIAAHVEMPLEIVEDGMRQLLARGVFVMTSTAVVMPNFLEAQEASQTTAHRSREYRARSRDAALHDVTSRDGSVTKRDASVTKRDDTVTARHETSQRVTPSLAEPNQEVDTLSGRPDSAPGEFAHLKAKVDVVAQQRPDPVVDFATTAVAEINRRAGTKFDPATKSTLRLAKALLKAKHTQAEAREVIAFRAPWLSDDTKREWFRPSTLLALDNFEKYLDESRARGGYASTEHTVTQAAERPEAVSPMMAFMFDDEEVPGVDAS
jgi:uncharacterized phage protein (TIGR02220 family)